MATTGETTFQIPARFRKMENTHILFWLVKDISWCMVWKVLGLLMIAPTLIISIIIAWRTREYRSELAHNLAISFWIVANSYWMISEFFGFDEVPVWRHFEGKHLAIIPFVIGILILLWHYIFQRETPETQASTL